MILAILLEILAAGSDGFFGLFLLSLVGQVLGILQLEFALFLSIKYKVIA